MSLDDDRAVARAAVERIARRDELPDGDVFDALEAIRNRIAREIVEMYERRRRVK